MLLRSRVVYNDLFVLKINALNLFSKKIKQKTN